MDFVFKTIIGLGMAALFTLPTLANSATLVPAAYAAAGKKNLSKAVMTHSNDYGTSVDVAQFYGIDVLNSDNELYFRARVCFFSAARYRGDAGCVDAGAVIDDLGTWSNKISSIKNVGGFTVTLCTEKNLGGDCKSYKTSPRTLGRLDDAIRSLSVAAD